MAANGVGPYAQGSSNYLNITGVTVVKTAPGVAVGACVVTGGSSAGAVYDNTGTVGNTTTNQVGVIGTTVGYVVLNALCASGIVIAPGTSQVVSLFFT